MEKPSVMIRAEKSMERGIFASRWLLAPFYLGLVVGLAVLLVKFVQELLHFAPGVLAATDSEVILGVLTLIDLSLAGNLLLIVIFAGYESFVSKIHVSGHEDRPAWMGTIDFSSMKLKLIASIVAISGIHLLKAFMNVDSIDKENLKWLVITHGAFVVSGVLLAWMDLLVSKAERLNVSK